MEEYVSRLKQIKKDELNEREFYEQVLSIIAEMEGVRLTPETAQLLKDTLIEIGCVEYDEWKAQKEANGETIRDVNIREGIQHANISTAVTFVSQLLYDYENAEFSLRYMLDGGEKLGWAQQWLARSKELERENGREHEDEVEISDKYTDIEQIISEIESLGDWKDPSQRDRYLKVISKIVAIYIGYELGDGKKQHFPHEVIRAIAHICSKKFPSEEEVFQDGKLRPGMPDVKFSNYVVEATTPLGISFLAERTGIEEIAQAKFGIDVYHTQMTEEEVKQLIESAEQYLAHNKSMIPYYSAAKQALMNWGNEQSNWVGLPEEEADKIISTQTFDEIEAQVNARKSMDYAIEAILDTRSMHDESDREELREFVYNGNVSDIMNLLAIRDRDSVNDIALDTLFRVHDGWVMDHPDKFNQREKKHQHLPSELIGWEEVKADLLFVKPIFEAAGIKLDEAQLEQLYNERVKQFFLHHNIRTTSDLANLISKGERFYPALRGQEEILTEISDPTFVTERVIPAIEQKGIGKVEDVRERILQQIAMNPNNFDLEMLSDEERKQVEHLIQGEMSTLEAQRDELKAKNDIVERIMALSRKRTVIREEILAEQRRQQGIIGSDE
ncbi:MAG: hypothetical protein IKP28_05835 [Clostridia bacterium]|nr:hypothetical protein [Clostridia bacterium]